MQRNIEFKFKTGKAKEFIKDADFANDEDDD